MFKLKYFQVLLIFILTAYADFQKKSNNTLIGGGEIKMIYSPIQAF